MGLYIGTLFSNIKNAKEYYRILETLIKYGPSDAFKEGVLMMFGYKFLTSGIPEFLKKALRNLLAKNPNYFIAGLSDSEKEEFKGKLKFLELPNEVYKIVSNQLVSDVRNAYNHLLRPIVSTVSSSFGESLANEEIDKLIGEKINGNVSGAINKLIDFYLPPSVASLDNYIDLLEDQKSTFRLISENVTQGFYFLSRNFFMTSLYASQSGMVMSNLISSVKMQIREYLKNDLKYLEEIIDKILSNQELTLHDMKQIHNFRNDFLTRGISFAFVKGVRGYRTGIEGYAEQLANKTFNYLENEGQQKKDAEKLIELIYGYVKNPNKEITTEIIKLFSEKHNREGSFFKEEIKKHLLDKGFLYFLMQNIVENYNKIKNDFKAEYKENVMRFLELLLGNSGYGNYFLDYSYPHFNINYEESGVSPLMYVVNFLNDDDFCAKIMTFAIENNWDRMELKTSDKRRLENVMSIAALRNKVETIKVILNSDKYSYLYKKELIMQYNREGKCALHRALKNQMDIKIFLKFQPRLSDLSSTGQLAISYYKDSKFLEDKENLSYLGSSLLAHLNNFDTSSTKSYDLDTEREIRVILHAMLNDAEFINKILNKSSRISEYLSFLIRLGEVEIVEQFVAKLPAIDIVPEKVEVLDLYKIMRNLIRNKKISLLGQILKADHLSNETSECLNIYSHGKNLLIEAVENSDDSNMSSLDFILNALEYSRNMYGVDFIDAEGNTPLLIAFKSGKYGICKKLIEKGASVYIKNNKGESALEYAKSFSSYSIGYWFANEIVENNSLEKIMESYKGYNPSIKEITFFPILLEFIGRQEKNIKIFEEFLSLIPEHALPIYDKEKENILFFAIDKNNFVYAAKIIENMPKNELKNYTDILIQYCQKVFQNKSSIKEHLAAIIDITSGLEFSETYKAEMLKLAYEYSQYDIIIFLINEKNANPLLKNSSGKSLYEDWNSSMFRNMYVSSAEIQKILDKFKTIEEKSVEKPRKTMIFAGKRSSFDANSLMLSISQKEKESFLSKASDLYIEDMRKNRTWGSGLELARISKLRNLKIILHQKIDGQISKNYPIGDAKSKEIHLLHSNGNHFDVCNDKGVVIRKISPDGNCLFSSIAVAENLSLTDSGDISKVALDIRNQVCDDLQEEVNKSRNGASEKLQDGTLKKYNLDDDPIRAMFLEIMESKSKAEFKDKMSKIPECRAKEEFKKIYKKVIPYLKRK